MKIEGAVAFVSGANRGLGRRFAAELLDRGAAKVYAAARNPDSIDLPGVLPVQLDLTDQASIERAAAAASDVTLLVNNAGSSTKTTLIDGDADGIRLDMETHYFGTLALTRALAPALVANSPAAILNVLSVLSWIHPAGDGAYSAGKAAAWAMTNAVRGDLADTGVLVAGLHVAYMDTDMAAHIPADQKSDPATVAAIALDGVEAGLTEILGDDLTRSVKAGLGAAVPA